MGEKTSSQHFDPRKNQLVLEGEIIFVFLPPS